MTGQAFGRGVPVVHARTRAELLSAGLLLGLAALAWLLTSSVAMPGMRVGILTGTAPVHAETGMDPGRGTEPAAFLLFLLTWVVMMAAMMLPAITPFTVGVRRLVRARPHRHGTLGALTVGYLLVWGLLGILAYLVLRGLESVAAGGTVTGVRVGAAVLLVTGVYQFTPAKRWCLRRCRSPLALVMRYGSRVMASRSGALLVGAGHGGYCVGCCWALMGVLLAVGVMNLAWMAVIAAVITMEKLAPRAEVVSSLLGVTLLGAGTVLLIAPGLLATGS